MIPLIFAIVIALIIVGTLRSLAGPILMVAAIMFAV